MSIDGPNDPSDQRSVHRKRTFLSGKLSYCDEAFSCDCVIRDISERGARVSVTNPQFIPERVVLIELKGLLAYDAIIRWRQGKMLGLFFEREIALDDPSLARNRALRRLAMATKGGPSG